MKKNIIIRKSPTADTRTCDVSKVTKRQLLQSSVQHISDVQKGLEYLAKRILLAGEKHDYTKLSELDSFYSDFKTGFKTTEWWELHKNTERHHLSKTGKIPSNVNLIDVLEYLVDGVMAGLARSGEYRREEIPEGLLEQAFENTIELLLSKTEVKED